MRRLLFVLAFIVALAVTVAPAPAVVMNNGVIVVTNHTRDPIRIQLDGAVQSVEHGTLQPGETWYSGRCCYAAGTSYKLVVRSIENYEANPVTHRTQPVDHYEWVQFVHTYAMTEVSPTVSSPSTSRPTPQGPRLARQIRTGHHSEPRARLLPRVAMAGAEIVQQMSLRVDPRVLVVPTMTSWPTTCATMTAAGASSDSAETSGVAVRSRHVRQKICETRFPNSYPGNRLATHGGWTGRNVAISPLLS